MGLLKFIRFLIIFVLIVGLLLIVFLYTLNQGEKGKYEFIEAKDNCKNNGWDDALRIYGRSRIPFECYNFTESQRATLGENNK